ncbi:hypothetical protein [Flavobacterium akiainvivens]|uniref:hypothetical protein n=1 Tax=Flavobacterium akiainvivens TaxID=1202724 RepID=UPI00116038B6|nr:hypothetical protein [Flavobacterium akiainvivens]
MERILKTLSWKGFLVFLVVALCSASCITQRGNLQIVDYTLLPNGKQTLGHDEGLTAFIFENNPRKRPFVQFLADKYGIGTYEDVQYNVDLDGHTFTVYLYDTAELNKYFDMSQFMVTQNETDANIVGSTAKFLGLSIVDDYNQDCLLSNSLYQNIAVKYLLNLKNEYYNL